jgi:hypothetical protein
MRRWETLTAIAGVVCAVVGSTRLPDHTAFTYLAIALIVVVGAARLQAALAKKAPAPSDAAERARRIREQRK